MAISSELGNQPPLEYLAAMLHRSTWWKHQQDIIKAIQMDKEGSLPILFEALKSNDHMVHGRAIWGLGYSGSEKAIEPLIQLLFDESLIVPDSIAGSLALIGKPAVPHLISALKIIKTEKKWFILDALGRIKDASTIELLLEYLKSDDTLTYGSAAKALRNIGEPAVMPLIKAAHDAKLRKRVWYAFLEFKDKAAVEPLISLLNKKGTITKQIALYALGQIGDNRAIEPMIEALNDDDKWIQSSGVQALGSFYKDYEQVLPVIMKLLFTDVSSNVQVGAVEALGKLGKQAIPQMIEALKSPNKEVRKKAANLLQRFRDESTLVPLVFATEDLEPEVQEAALLALQNYKEPLLVEVALPLFLKNTGKIKLAAARVLKNFKDARSVKPFIEALYVPDNELREVVALALGEWKIEDAFADLLPLLDDTNEKVRCVAIRALGYLGNPEAVKPLLRLYANATNHECYWLGNALGKLGSNWNGNAQILLPLLEAYKKHLQGFWQHDPEFQCYNCEQFQFAIDSFTNILLPTLLDWFEKETNMRGYLAQFLGASKDSHAYSLLLASLDDETIIYDIVTALYLINEPLTTDVLIQLLKENKDGMATVARFLGHFENYKAVEPLLNYLKNDLTWIERSLIFEALGIIGDERALPTLLEFAEKVPIEDEYYGTVRNRLDEAITRLESSDY